MNKCTQYFQSSVFNPLRPSAHFELKLSPHTCPTEWNKSCQNWLIANRDGALFRQYSDNEQEDNEVGTTDGSHLSSHGYFYLCHTSGTLIFTYQFIWDKCVSVNNNIVVQCMYMNYVCFQFQTMYLTLVYLYNSTVSVHIIVDTDLLLHVEQNNMNGAFLV